MIQLAMIFALGFLVASLLALAVMPVLARRAERRARRTLERQLPLSLPEIAAERDQLRAGHALTVRQLEQRIEGLDARNAALLGDAGRQSTRLVALDHQHRVDSDLVAGLRDEALGHQRTLRDCEATAAAQAIALHDATSTAEQQRERLAAATARAAAADALTADQRTVIADLEARVGRATSHMASEGVHASRLTDDVVRLQAAHVRLKTEHDMMRESFDGIAGERERLRFRVDELLLQIVDHQEDAETLSETLRETRVRVQQLTARLAARDEALEALKRQLATETARREAAETSHAATPSLNEPAALRRAIASLAADLVRVAERSAELDPPPLTPPALVGIPAP